MSDKKAGATASKKKPTVITVEANQEKPKAPTGAEVRNEIMKMEPITDNRHLANSIDGATTLEQKRMFAAQMIQSGLLPATLATPDQLEDDDYRDKAIGGVIAIVEYGREINITPWVALNNMHVVQGKVVMGIHMYTGLALKNNIHINILEDYVNVYNKDKKLIDRRTTVEITRMHPLFGIKATKFTKKWSEIKAAGLDTRDNYKKRPITMLRTRCITEGLRIYAADIFMGTLETTEVIDITNTSYTVDEDGALASK